MAADVAHLQTARILVKLNEESAQGLLRGTITRWTPAISSDIVS
jgi:hypothetical protein